MKKILFFISIITVIGLVGCDNDETSGDGDTHTDTSAPCIATVEGVQKPAQCKVDGNEIHECKVGEEVVPNAQCKLGEFTPSNGDPVESEAEKLVRLAAEEATRIANLAEVE